MRSGQKRFLSEDWRIASEAEGSRAWKEYFGYFGTYSIDLHQEVVIHHVEGAWFPNLMGQSKFAAIASKVRSLFSTPIQSGTSSHRMATFGSSGACFCRRVENERCMVHGRTARVSFAQDDKPAREQYQAG